MSLKVAVGKTGLLSSSAYGTALIDVFESPPKAHPYGASWANILFYEMGKMGKFRDYPLYLVSITKARADDSISAQVDTEWIVPPDKLRDAEKPMVLKVTWLRVEEFQVIFIGDVADPSGSAPKETPT